MTSYCEQASDRLALRKISFMARMSPDSAVRWHAVAPSNDDQAHLVYIEDYVSEVCQFYSNEELK